MSAETHAEPTAPSATRRHSPWPLLLGVASFGLLVLSFVLAPQSLPSVSGTPGDTPAGARGWQVAPGARVPLPLAELLPGAARIRLRLECSDGACADLRILREGETEALAPARARGDRVRFDVGNIQRPDEAIGLTNLGERQVTVEAYELQEIGPWQSSGMRKLRLALLLVATFGLAFLARAFRTHAPAAPVEIGGGIEIDGRARTVRWPARLHLRAAIALGLAMWLGLAITVRLAGVHEGLPYFHHWDEAGIVDRPVSAIRDHRLLFDSYDYPQLYSYLIAPAVAWGYDRARDRHEIESWSEVQTGWGMGEDRIHPSSIYVASRSLSALLGLLALVFLQRYVRALFSPATAWLAVLLAALSLGHVTSSWYVVLDGPACAFAIGSLWWLTRACRSTARRHDFVVLALFTALSMATKYNNVMLVPAALAALLMRPRVGDASERAVGRWHGLLLYGLPLGGFFLLLSPSLILHPVLTVQAALHEASLYRGDGAVDELAVFLDHLARFGEYLRLSNGIVPTVLAALGVISVLAAPDRRRVGWLLLFPVIMVVYMCSQYGKYFNRNLIAPMLLANVLAALGYFFAVEMLARFAKPTTARIGTTALTAVVALSLAAHAGVAVDLTLAANAPETRSRALAHLIEAQVRTPVWIDDRVRLNLLERPAHLDFRPYELRTLGADAIVGPAWLLAPLNEIDDLEQRVPRAERVASFEMAPGLARQVEVLLASLGVPGPRATTATPIYSHNPTLHLYRIP